MCRGNCTQPVFPMRDTLLRRPGQQEKCVCVRAIHAHTLSEQHSVSCTANTDRGLSHSHELFCIWLLYSRITLLSHTGPVLESNKVLRSINPRQETYQVAQQETKQPWIWSKVVQRPHACFQVLEWRADSFHSSVFLISVFLPSAKFPCSVQSHSFVIISSHFATNKSHILFQAQRTVVWCCAGTRTTCSRHGGVSRNHRERCVMNNDQGLGCLQTVYTLCRIRL